MKAETQELKTLLSFSVAEGKRKFFCCRDWFATEASQTTKFWFLHVLEEGPMLHRFDINQNF